VWKPCDADAPAWFRAKNRLTAAIARRRERAALDRARIVIANSNRTRSDLIRTLGIDPAIVHTVYPGSDPSTAPASQAERAAAREWLGVPNDRPLAVFVGLMGYDSNKGFDTLVAAWRELCASCRWDVDLIAAGGGRGSAEWARRITRKHLSSRIRLLGFTDQIPKLLAAADLLISPVRYEGYGMNVQEAVCRGVPAMVSRNAGIAERFPEHLRELLVDDPNSVEEVAARLVSWRAHMQEWKLRVGSFSQMLRRHSWTRMCERILAISEPAHEGQAN
jgi:glycosyltransferase involved in cell wall biosynthesis